MARHIVITDGGPTPMHLADFNAAYKRLCRNLDREGKRWEHYLWALECRPDRGHLHRHVIALGGPFLHRSVLAEHARRAGVGYIGARLGETPEHRVRLSGYVAAAGVGFAAAHAGLAPRIQPFARSVAAAEVSRSTPR